MTFKVHASFHEIQILPKKTELNFKLPKKSIHFYSDWTEHEDNNLMFGIKNSLVKKEYAQLEVNLQSSSSEYMHQINHQLSENVETLIYMKGKNCLHLCKIDSIKILDKEKIILTLNDLYLENIKYDQECQDELVFETKTKNVFSDLKWSHLRRQCTRPYVEAQEFLRVGVYKHQWNCMSLYTKHYLTQAHLLKMYSPNKGIKQKLKNTKSRYFHYHNAIISELNDIFIDPVKSYIKNLDQSKLSECAKEILSAESIITKRIESIGDFLEYVDKAPFECYRILKVLDKSLFEESLVLQHVIRTLDCQISLLLKQGITKKLFLFEKLMSRLKLNEEEIQEELCIELIAFLDEFMSSNKEVNLIFFFQEFKGSSRIDIKNTFERIELLVA